MSFRFIIFLYYLSNMPNLEKYILALPTVDMVLQISIFFTRV